MPAIASTTRTNAPPAGRPGGAARLFEPVPIAPLVQFRIALGLILLWEAYRYMASGWPRTLFLEREVLFPYFGFEWVRPLPPALHLAVFPALALLAVCVTAGLFYRVAAALLFLGWAYVFLLDQALYLNHLYFVTLIAGLMTLLPANRALSLDVRLRPALEAETVPRWTLTLLRAQVGLVYFFGGVAKLEGDWLTGVPMQQMLLERGDLLGQAAGEPWVALFFAYAGLLLDLFLVPLLWWPKTRMLALLLATGFHLTNHTIFRIGIFPWFAMAATLILWPPFPLSLLTFARIYGVLVLLGMILARVAGRYVPDWSWGVALVAAAVLVFFGEEIRKRDLTPEPRKDKLPADGVPPRVRPAILALLALYLGWQTLMPLRHFAYDLRDGRYDGSVSWTELGHKWSWHMKLRIKHADPLFTRFYVLDADGRELAEIDPFAADSPLTFRQARTMSTRPDLVLRFAHYLRDKYGERAGGPVTVRASIQVSLNGREPAYLVDPEADLAAIEPRLWPPATWILSLDVPRRPLERVDVERFLAARRGFGDGVDRDEL